ncbi:hypothetical protein C7M84_002817 [Penaeus vannamei]|uniref:Uncharacterized protein n=1 Tax=Penaeus vannamei TaxID=6689 RepID=A0A423TPW9_PENVA|nr:hypothetical protein C7M84_002817 [Penaeus vannamei]
MLERKTRKLYRKIWGCYQGGRRDDRYTFPYPCPSWPSLVPLTMSKLSWTFHVTDYLWLQRNDVMGTISYEEFTGSCLEFLKLSQELRDGWEAKGDALQEGNFYLMKLERIEDVLRDCPPPRDVEKGKPTTQRTDPSPEMGEPDATRASRAWETFLSATPMQYGEING